MRDRVDLDHFAVVTRAVVLREFAERAFALAHAGQERPSITISASAGTRTSLVTHLTTVERRAVQRAGDLEFVVVDRRDRLRRQQRQRIDADHDGDIQRLAGLLGLLVERVEVARQQQDAHAVAAR